MTTIRRERESSIENTVVRRALAELGLCSLKLTPRGQRGWADRMFLLPRSPAFVEFKRAGDVPRPLQEHRAIGMLTLGYDLLLGADDVDTTMNWLARIQEARP